MPGKRITSQQVKRYMTLRKAGFSQIVSSAKSGLSERSGRNIEKGRHQSKSHQVRNYRTRKDPLAQAWGSECVPMLEQHPSLLPITLLEYLQEKYPKQYSDQLLRTMERRVKSWKAIHGPEKEVMFRQTHVPGQQGLSDFTHPKMNITIQGKPLKHLLYHFRLVFSKWSYLKVILGGESYTALTEGLQEALWRLGGSPKEHRTDSLSAAFKNLSALTKEDVIHQYQAFCQHYHMTPTRNNLGKKHENGAVESPHGHLKRRISQALFIRGSNDFESIEAYQTFIDQVVRHHNRRHTQTIDIEKQALQPLPIYRTQDFTETVVKVTSSSTISVRRVTYSVPSRLCGETLRIHLYDDRLCCFLGSVHVITLDRVRLKGKKRARSIDYRHVIKSLVKKPAAFRYSQFREDLLPNAQYKTIWQYIDQTYGGEKASKLMVKLLYLASESNHEEALAEQVLALIDDQKPIVINQLESRFLPKNTIQPKVEVIQHSLQSYDQLL